MRQLDPRAREILATSVLLAILVTPATFLGARDCPVSLTGDLTGDLRLTSGDIIAMVNLAFKCDFGCPPCDYVIADVNCSGSFTSADVISMVNHLFKNGPPPCDICPLLEDGTYPPGICP